MTTAFPLHWPANYPRHKKQSSSKFQTTLAAAITNVKKSLELFGGDTSLKVSGIVISSNYSLGDHNPNDAGVAVWFNWGDEQRCIPIDKYGKIQDNLQAIHHIIEAERVKFRHGGLTIVKATFNAYAQLPSPATAGGTVTQWWEVLGVNSDADAPTIKKAYQKLRSLHHPDRSGDPVEYQKVLDAFAASARVG